MKKRCLTLVLCLALSVSMLFAFATTAFASNTGYNYNQAKLRTLFFSQCLESDGSLLASFNWSSFASADGNGVVIVPYVSVNSRNTWNIGQNGLQNQNLADRMVAIVKRLVAENSSIKVWIGTAGIDSTCYGSANSTTCLDNFTNYLNIVKSALGTNIWNNNVVGVYYNQESIYGNVDYSSLLSNSEIKLMNDFAYRVHTTFYKDLLWIPYYGYGVNAASIIKKIGYVANTKNIFDCVILQASYMVYGNNDTKSNFPGICYSVENQTICYRDGTSVVARTSNATATIGAEFELNTYQTDRFPIYTSNYLNYVDNRPLAFYWQGTWSTARTYINNIY